MWHIKKPDPVKLVMGILAADQECLQLACEAVMDVFGATDMISEVYPFTQTSYYKDEAGENILRQFLSFEKLIDPGKLATIKIKSNKLEEKLAKIAGADLSRPINLDPGIIEPSKLILASTKNFSHRIYIGDNIYAELTLSYCKGVWNSFSYTFPDFKEDRYHKFFSGVRERLVEQLRGIRKKD